MARLIEILRGAVNFSFTKSTYLISIHMTEAISSWVYITFVKFKVNTEHTKFYVNLQFLTNDCV